MQAQVEAARARLAESVALEQHARRKDVPEGARWCAGCQSFVPLWYSSGSRCKACASEARTQARTRSVYGVGPDEHARVLALQGGACAICRKRQVVKRLAVDHDHKTGAPRGLLCQRCNHDLLGAAYDSVNILRSAVAYLESPPFGGDWTPPTGL
jgi:hypothetical protein